MPYNHTFNVVVSGHLCEPYNHTLHVVVSGHLLVYMYVIEITWSEACQRYQPSCTVGQNDVGDIKVKRLCGMGVFSHATPSGVCSVHCMLLPLIFFLPSHGGSNCLHFP